MPFIGSFPPREFVVWRRGERTITRAGRERERGEILDYIRGDGGGGVIDNVGRIFGERHVEFGPDGEHGATHLPSPPFSSSLPRFVSSVDRIIFVFARYRVVPVPVAAIRDHIPAE